MILTESTYPERHAYGFINDMQRELFKMNNYFASSDVEVKNYTLGYIPGLLRKYNDLRSLDTLWSAQRNVEDISITMQKNIATGLYNRENLENLDKKSKDMSNLAASFKDNAAELDKIQKARNKKMMALIITAISALVIVVIVINAV